MSSVEATPPIDFSRLGPSPGYRLAVVGSHGGIGAALCRAACATGLRVAALDTAAAIAERPQAEAEETLPMDVLDPGTVKAAFGSLLDRWNGLDGLAYVTGIGLPPTGLTDHGVDDWDRTLDVNLRGAFIVASTARSLLTAGSSSVVFVASGLALNVEPGFSAYSASKAGLIALAKVLAKEWAPEVRVNSIAPGLVQTPFLGGGTGQGRVSDGGLEEWFGAVRAKAMREAVPLGRIAEPDDIAAPMLFLLGAGARFMTGQTLHVNGGRFLP